MSRRDYSWIALLGLVVAVVIGINWNSFAGLDKMLTIGTVGILAVSLGLVYGQGGMLSVAQAAFAAMGAYSTAILVTRLEVSPWVGLPVAIVVPATLAYVLARVIVRLSPLALAVATLVFAEVWAYGLSAGGDFTGGFIGITGIPTPELLVSRREQAIAAWILVILCVLITSHIMRSQQGRALRVLAIDRTLGASLGADAAARLAALFALGAAMAGSAGWIYAHSRSYLAPNSLPVLLSLEVLMMVIIGGQRALLGPVLGAVVLTTVNDALPSVEIRGLIYGLVLVLILVVLPNGLLGVRSRQGSRAARSLRNRLPARFRSDADPEATPDGVLPTNESHSRAEEPTRSEVR